MAIAEGIAAIKATLELAKLTSDAVKRPKIDPADVQAKLQEMLIHAVNAYTALTEAKLELSALQSQLDERQALEALKADMDYVEDGGFWIRKSEQVALRTIRYCNVCWSVKHNLVPLSATGSEGVFSCQVDNSQYQTKAFRERLRRAQNTPPRGI